jgi:hypothetical protein
VALAVACACGALAPAAYASLGVPTSGSMTVTGSGASTASAMAAFEQDAGGTDNGTTAGEQGGGYRHATWDQIALDGSDPGATTIEPGSVIAPASTRLEPWGLGLGSGIAVSNDGFQFVNPDTFTPFSPANVWGTFNTNIANLQVVAPAVPGSTPTPAQTRGLGIVFLDVTGSTQVQIQYYNGDIPLLQTPLSPPVGTTSFAGLLFPDAVVTRVAVTLGGAHMFDFNGTTVTQGGAGAVAGDDIALAEPGPKLQATTGVAISPVLDTFTNTGSNAVATVDWGDGTRTAGTIAPAPGGAFNVTGSHAYAQAGAYTATVTVDDFSGDQQSSYTLINVAPRSSATSVTCAPSRVAVTSSTICTATVSDVGAGGPITPTGTVVFSSPTPGASFDADSGCALGATSTPGEAICEVQLTPTQLPPAQARIDAVYAGDGAHATSSDSAVVGVRAQRCALKALSARLKGRPPSLGVLVTCDARATVTIAGKAVGARKGRFKAFTLSFGSVRAAVTAGRPTVLVIKPSQSVVSALHAASRRHQRVMLRLTLTASSHATQTTTTTRVAAFRIS